MLNKLQYAMEFMKAIKESPKKTFPESVNYFTNPKGSWYPPAKNKLDFHYAC